MAKDVTVEKDNISKKSEMPQKVDKELVTQGQLNKVILNFNERMAKVDKIYDLLVTGDELNGEGLFTKLRPILNQYEADSRVGSDGLSQYQRRDKVIEFFFSWKIVASVVMFILGIIGGVITVANFLAK